MQPSLCGSGRHLFHGYDGNLTHGAQRRGRSRALPGRRRPFPRGMAARTEPRPPMAAAFPKGHGGADGARALPWRRRPFPWGTAARTEPRPPGAAAFSTGHGGADGAAPSRGGGLFHGTRRRGRSRALPGGGGLSQGARRRGRSRALPGGGGIRLSKLR